MKIKRNIIDIDEDLCDGCGNCVLACAEGAIEIIDGKAKVISDKYCDGLGACIGDCPQGALKIVQKRTDEFDEKAVEELLAKKKQNKTLACGCPSSELKILTPESGTCDCANSPKEQHTGSSNLRHWPVQIRLIPANAPFLKNADLLVAADCVPVAFPDFHGAFLKDKTVMIGCPKFDNPDEYVDKFTDIFNTADINSIKVLSMEVPCCSGMPMIIEKALTKSGRDISVQRIVIDAKGKIVDQLEDPASSRTTRMV